MDFFCGEYRYGGRRNRHRKIYWHRYRHRDLKIESFQICRLRRDGRRGGGGGPPGGEKPPPPRLGGGGGGGGGLRGEHNAPRRGFGDGERDRNADARHYSC